MRKFLMTILVAGALISCKDNPVSKKIKETKESVSNTTKAVKEMTKMQDVVTDLSKLEPLTNEELKSWLPDEINGMKRIKYNAGQVGMMNISSISATYTNEDKSKEFSFSLIDGAGEAGAVATAGLRMVMTQDFEEESENGYRKTTTRKGQKAIEEFNSRNNKTSIQFVDDRRFFLEVDGKNMDVEETWKAIDKLNINKLG